MTTHKAQADLLAMTQFLEGEQNTQNQSRCTLLTTVDGREDLNSLSDKDRKALLYKALAIFSRNNDDENIDTKHV